MTEKKKYVAPLVVQYGPFGGTLEQWMAWLSEGAKPSKTQLRRWRIRGTRELVIRIEYHAQSMNMPYERTPFAGEIEFMASECDAKSLACFVGAPTLFAVQ